MPSSAFSPVRIGNIYQRFGSLESGLCQNIIKASVPFVLEEGMYTYATGHACGLPAVALQHSCSLLAFLTISTRLSLLATASVSTCKKSNYLVWRCHTLIDVSC